MEACPPKDGGDDRLKTVLKALADEPKAAPSCGACDGDDSCSAKASGKKAGKEAKKAVDKAMKKVEDKAEKKEQAKETVKAIKKVEK